MGGTGRPRRFRHRDQREAISRLAGSLGRPRGDSNDLGGAAGGATADHVIATNGKRSPGVQPGCGWGSGPDGEEKGGLRRTAVGDDQVVPAVEVEIRRRQPPRVLPGR